MTDTRTTTFHGTFSTTTLVFALSVLLVTRPVPAYGRFWFQYFNVSFLVEDSTIGAKPQGTCGP